MEGFPCSSVGKESACIAGDLSLIPGLGSSPGEGHGKRCCQWGGMDPLLECDGACHSPKKPNTIKPQLSRSQITRMINKTFSYTELLEERWWTQENMSVLELLFFFFKASNIYLSNKSVREISNWERKVNSVKAILTGMRNGWGTAASGSVRRCPRLPLQSGLQLAGWGQGAAAFPLVLLCGFCIHLPLLLLLMLLLLLSRFSRVRLCATP